MTTTKERPKKLAGDSHRVLTGCGKLYITINSLDGKVFEVFARLGKAGGCMQCYTEVLSKSISIGLRSGISLERFHKILSEVKCNMPSYDEGELILSCADAMAKVIKKYLPKDDSAK